MTTTPEDNKDLNRSQFGANANNYADSPVHAKGASLARMVELAEPQSNWRSLDIATAAGHTAFAFAPHVAHVTAVDLTPEMVTLAAERAIELGHDNVAAQLADAEDLPFDNDSFELVTCRIAPHHFPNPELFINEVARVLAPGGLFVMVDNIASGDPDVARFADDFERRRDPSHVRCLPVAEWTSLMSNAGLTVRTTETSSKRMGFEWWANNMSVAEDVQAVLLAELHAASPMVHEFLRPEGSTVADTVFFLTEGLFVAAQPA